MAIENASGTTIGISVNLPDTFDSVASTGYPSETYTIIGEVVSIPPYGAQNNVARHNPLGEIDIVKKPGSRDHGSLSIPMALDDADAGQTLIEANLRTECAFEITHPSGATRHFTGYLMGFTEEPGNSDSIISANVTIELTRAVVKTDA